MTVQEQDSQETKQKYAVLITYNGMNASFDYKPEQAAESVRVHALDHYDIRGSDQSTASGREPVAFNLVEQMARRIVTRQVLLRLPTALDQVASELESYSEKAPSR